ncbi:hypothetical protein [Synechococcus sp. PCC 7336]|uniref:hypothetical protein n=1 Tax=Synechococcus sp. PCC 7336 TaxID=195250 RepID=UPI0003473DA2|nr:hypothetical protein [Synechococcus sp. PCC 7336]
MTPEIREELDEMREMARMALQVGLQNAEAIASLTVVVEEIKTITESNARAIQALSDRN